MKNNSNSFDFIQYSKNIQTMGSLKNSMHAIKMWCKGSLFLWQWMNEWMNEWEKIEWTPTRHKQKIICHHLFNNIFTKSGRNNKMTLEDRVCWSVHIFMMYLSYTRLFMLGCASRDTSLIIGKRVYDNVNYSYSSLKIEI